MPEKYHIQAADAPHRFEPISKLASIEMERCLGCLQCAKRDCIYDVYEKRKFLSGQLIDTSGSSCKSCMRCVQECRNNILTKTLNPDWAAMGNSYWTPQIITSLQQQAATGKIPVSGAGYDGPFTGAGFDSMWTDMSEIVRPTRDGIHGREYISTSVDIGRKPDHLVFEGKALKNQPPFILQIPMPVILDIPKRVVNFERVARTVAGAAKKAGIILTTDNTTLSGAHFAPRFVPGQDFKPDQSHTMAELFTGSLQGSDPGQYAQTINTIAKQFPDTIICAGLLLDEHALETSITLAEQGVGAIRLYADVNGNGFGKHRNRFIKDMVRSIHLALVEHGLRDAVTLIAGGGIAMAEHVVKLVACGADLVALDEALLVALECRLCAECDPENGCPVHIKEIEQEWGEQRIINLLASWHSQLIELMGAMGIREARRLRGETGRVMFFEDLEEECFSPVFGKRKQPCI